MSRPTISACIAVYNGSKYLARAIESVKAQTVPVDEIVVVDDGSTDDSAAIASGFDGVRVIRQANAGIGGARKTLVEQARCDWIAFCDHDDWWEPDRLAAQLELTSDPETVLIYSAVRQGGEELKLHASPDQGNLAHLIPHPEDIWTSSTLIRREAMLRVGNFDPSFRCGEDMLMWFQLGTIGRIRQVPRPLIQMERLEGSTSSGKKSVHAACVRLYEEKVLPNLSTWYPESTEEQRRLLERKMGYAKSILANYIDREGDHKEARRLHRDAVRLCPTKGVLYRYARSLLGAPGMPPI